MGGTAGLASFILFFMTNKDNLTFIILYLFTQDTFSANRLAEFEEKFHFFLGEGGIPCNFFFHTIEQLIERNCVCKEIVTSLK